MPKVDGKHFAYSAAGKKAAEMAKKMKKKKMPKKGMM
jgi:hypothetical protein